MLIVSWTVFYFNITLAEYDWLFIIRDVNNCSILFIAFSYDQLPDIIQSLKFLETSEATLSKDRRSALSKLMRVI